VFEKGGSKGPVRSQTLLGRATNDLLEERMNTSGRNYVQAESSNTVNGLAVLNSVSNNVDCMFAHLRRKPPTGTIDESGSRKRKPPAEPEEKSSTLGW
jgi:hypothetical protein